MQLGPTRRDKIPALALTYRFITMVHIVSLQILWPGNLYLNSNKVVITNAADTFILANFIENGAVIFYDASKKLETTADGVFGGTD